MLFALMACVKNGNRKRTLAASQSSQSEILHFVFNPYFTLIPSVPHICTHDSPCPCAFMIICDRQVYIVNDCLRWLPIFIQTCFWGSLIFNRPTLIFWNLNIMFNRPKMTVSQATVGCRSALDILNVKFDIIPDPPV